MEREQLLEHLKFAAELGVQGISRDPVWRARPETLALRPVDSLWVVPSNVEGRQAQDERTPQSLMVSVSNHELRFSRNPAEALAAVRAEIGDCTRCKLHAMGRRQIVFGVGHPDADLMFVGEAPGAD